MRTPVLTTDLPGLGPRHRGKVRDIYDLGDRLLLVATDRISAFDVVMADPIPDKGRILTKISAFWFRLLADVIPNHLISLDVNEFPPACQAYRDLLAGRTMLVRKTRPLPVECIVRGYLAGSGWADYQKTQTVCGIPLPAGLRESDRLPEPIFPPSTKAELGTHDENITLAEVAAAIGPELAEKVKEVSLTLYRRASSWAEPRGIILADTKFEFGLRDGQLLLIDEVLTPDSSRFWPKDDYAPGRPQKSYDKQYLRDYLESLGWNKQPPPPPLPPEVIANTRAKYLEALKSLTGEDLA
uniref:Phosphoribosylaminoimidazole-succinocarboxamide synthase n=1 Tax=Desulfobacca acetoxidans TaxID=60893 RepID=A0A7C3Z1B2_9BACT